jgi:DNA mismatch repair protein MutL
MNQNNRIKKLPNNLINQIAAGEVVERPASVVKELLENSLDAYATKITIELIKGGKDLIRVIDNGLGLSSDQFDLVFERHATSKIDSIDALNNNLNLGFRGEALAAISSVSKIEFASNGNSINSDGELKPKAMPAGTQVSVESLFYNVPARLKFLKTDATEYGKSLSIIEAYALCHYNIHFKLIHNQKVILDYPKTDSAEARVYQVLGKDFTDKLLPIYYGGTDTKMSGFIGRPELARDKPYNQYIFVNGRPIDAPYFNHAVKNAFGSMIFPSEKPPFLIWIDLNPTEVDMNVHPRKQEARFHYQGIIYNLILKAVKQTIEKTSLAKTIQLSQEPLGNFLPQKNSNYHNTSFDFSSPKPSYDFSAYQRNSNSGLESSSPDAGTAEDYSTKEFLKPLAQIANSYIVCESDQGVIFIDQHAAHERVMYQKIKKAKLTDNANKQNLLLPIQIQLSVSQADILKNSVEILNSIGFDISDFGSNTVVVNSIPAKFSQNDIDDLVLGLLEDLSTGVDFSKLEEIEDIVINYAACRGAIKFGQKLNMPEMEALISEMNEIKHLQYSCPHGRPTTVTITFDELEKEFKRKK